MTNFKPFRPKEKKGVFQKRDEMLDDIYNYQNNKNPEQAAEDEYPNLRKKKEGKKKSGFFG